MATYYPCSANQRDAIANFYLRDPTGHAVYPESAINGNMIYLNYPFGAYSETLAGSLQPQPSCIGFTDLVASHLSENAYSSWRDGRNEMLFLHENDESIGGDDPRMGILNEHNIHMQHSNISNVQKQGLSLSLGTQIPVSSFKYQSISENGRIMDANVSSYELTGITSSIPNSKYLKTAQQLLEEVVNVQRALKKKVDSTQSASTSGKLGGKDNDGESKSGESPSINHAELATQSSSELSASERQEFQNKMTKLLTMLDEVDRKYKQYYHQMQIVVSSFDSIAGSGAAKPYTVLALQTISRHFRSLRDAITDQIRCTRKMLGEPDALKGKGCGISRLRYVDQHLRQQRAIQQLGMMPQHAWRPQRGLPENSVTILRAWLFEHFLHPYPNDSEKLMLSRQTGLTRSQVSNWFINARVRLWKPMVEDMYKEEFGETEMDSNSSSENPTKFTDEVHLADVLEDQAKQQSHELSPSFMPQTNETQYHRQQNGLHDAIRLAEQGSGFITYPMADLARYSNGGVSLELGLQHCNGDLQDSTGQQGFLAVRGEDIYSAAPLMGFSSSNSLHDFVA